MGSNKLTYENTKNASDLYWCSVLGQFAVYSLDKLTTTWQDGDEIDATHSEIKKGSILNLNDQTDRGYPTLKYFLEQGKLLEVGDVVDGVEIDDNEVLPSTVEYWNVRAEDDIKRYVKKTSQDIDLTQMAREEYYANKAREFPSSERIDVIGQNGNDGLHYDGYTHGQDVYLINGVNGDGWKFGCYTLDRGACLLLRGGSHMAMPILGISATPPKTDEQILRDEMIRTITSEGDSFSTKEYAELDVDKLLSKFNITRKES